MAGERIDHTCKVDTLADLGGGVASYLVSCDSCPWSAYANSSSEVNAVIAGHEGPRRKLGDHS